MNNQDQLKSVSSNLVDRINQLNLNINQNDMMSKPKKSSEMEKELRVLNELFVSIRKVIHFYNEVEKNKK
jgi:hypothetical protein